MSDPQVTSCWAVYACCGWAADGYLVSAAVVVVAATAEVGPPVDL